MWSYTEDELLEEVERIGVHNIMLLILVKLGVRTASSLNVTDDSMLDYIKSRYPMLYYYRHSKNKIYTHYLVFRDPITDEEHRKLTIPYENKYVGKALDYPCWDEWLPVLSDNKPNYYFQFHARMKTKFNSDDVLIFGCACKTTNQISEFETMLHKYNKALKSEESIVAPIINKVYLKIIPVYRDN